MLRRFFLKSVPGFILAPSLLKPVTETSISEQYKSLARLMFEPLERLKKYRFMLMTSDETYFKGPNVRFVKVTDNSITFEAEQIKVDKVTQFSRVILLTPEGKYCTAKQCYCFLNVGDKYTLSYTVQYV